VLDHFYQLLIARSRLTIAHSPTAKFIVRKGERARHLAIAQNRLYFVALVTRVIRRARPLFSFPTARRQSHFNWTLLLPLRMTRVPSASFPALESLVGDDRRSTGRQCNCDLTIQTTPLALPRTDIFLRTSYLPPRRSKPIALPRSCCPYRLAAGNPIRKVRRALAQSIPPRTRVFEISHREQSIPRYWHGRP
jgi:hypothetical protein